MLTIRNVEPQDIFSVIKLAHETLPERYTPSLFTTFYEGFPQGFFIALNHQKIVGFLIGIKSDTNTAKILMIAVDKNYRKKGVGSALLHTFFNKMMLENIHRVTLEVRTNNSSALQFYINHGFIIYETIKGFYQKGEDAYSMIKKIINA